MSDFRQFAESHGLLIGSIYEGKIIRCPAQSKPRNKNGAYFFGGDWGWAMDWYCHDEPIYWKSEGVTDDQLKVKIKQHNQNHSAEKRRLSDQAIKKTEKILSECELDFSSYLAKKGFPDMCANIWKTENENVLIVPMYRDKKLSGCQRIYSDGSKKFMYGQQSKGAYFRIGSGSRLFYTEGYASALTLQLILSKLKIDYSIFVCFSASNLTHLSTDSGGFVIADHDAHGKGENAAIKSGCKYWMPPLVGMDINDYWSTLGTFKTSQLIKKAVKQK